MSAISLSYRDYKLQAVTSQGIETCVKGTLLVSKQPVVSCSKLSVVEEVGIRRK